MDDDDGDLRVSLLMAYLAIAGLILWIASGGGDFDQLQVAVGGAAVLLAIPTERVLDVRLDVPVATLGILPVSLVVFGLGLAAPVLLVLAPWVGLVGVVLYVVAYVAFARTVRRAFSREVEMLRSTAGDDEVGYCTTVPPTSPSIISSGPPPTINGGRRPSGGVSFRYDASAVHDPLETWTRKPMNES